ARSVLDRAPEPGARRVRERHPLLPRVGAGAPRGADDAVGDLRADEGAAGGRRAALHVEPHREGPGGAAGRAGRAVSAEDETREGNAMSEEKRAKGAAKFEEVIGFAPPERGPDFLRITVENLFGDVWSREGLSVRDRRLITLTVLALLGKESSIEL